jgi:hypothetical protein
MSSVPLASVHRVRILRPHSAFAKRVAAALGQGEFIPSKPGTIGFGYSLWARHENGDVIVHCGANAGWFDWFTPVLPGDAPDFELTIEDRQYRLVRGVDTIPATFLPAITHPGKGHTLSGAISVERRGRPPGPRLVPWSTERRNYMVEGFLEGRWQLLDSCRSEFAATSQAKARYVKDAVPHRVVYLDAVLREFSSKEAL